VPKEANAEALARLRAGEIDVVTFASSSAVRNLVRMLGSEMSLLEKPLIACIGPVTARAARRLGLRVDVEASEHTVEGLASALVGRLGK
jgi:uroporphyrinogen III methyltransferase/synthase